MAVIIQTNHPDILLDKIYEAIENKKAEKWECTEDGRLTYGADRKSTRLNSSHVRSSYAVFCWKKIIDRPARGEGADDGGCEIRGRLEAAARRFLEDASRHLERPSREGVRSRGGHPTCGRRADIESPKGSIRRHSATYRRSR